MSPNGSVIKSVLEVASRFTAELFSALPDWEARLKADPESLEEIEREIHQAAVRGAALELRQRAGELGEGPPARQVVRVHLDAVPDCHQYRLLRLPALAKIEWDE